MAGSVRLVACLMAWIVVVRLVPYVLLSFGVASTTVAMVPWNFSPVMAICLFGGAKFLSRTWAFVVPLGAMLLSDLVLLIWKGSEFAIYPHQPLVYACFATGILLGLRLRKMLKPGRIVSSAIVAEGVFYLVTNFGVWLLHHDQAPTFYTSGLSGLLQCYVAGIPFLLRSLGSTFLYSAVLFGVADRFSVSGLVPQRS